MLKECPGAAHFVTSLASVGVLDVRMSEAPATVLVFVRDGIDEVDLDTIRVLARAQWPEQRIVIAPRVAVRETGDFARIAVGDDDEQDDVPKTG
jgi:hypothetical protein